MKKQFICCIFVILVSASLTFAQPAKTKKGPAWVEPANAKIYHDLEYARADANTPLLLDLYEPKSAADGNSQTAKPLPLIIFIHGGGWRNGSKAAPVPVTAGFLEKGYAVASVDYRLSGKAVWPAQIYDCKAAIRYLRGNARKYDLDPAKFGVWGGSAGGHLVAMLGATNNTTVLDGKLGTNLNVSSSIQAVCDWYGPTDLLNMADANGHVPKVLDEVVVQLLGGPIKENIDKAKSASPVTYVSKDCPPFLIMHGDKDPTVPVEQSKLLYDKLIKSGAKAELKIVNGAGHGGPLFQKDDVHAAVVEFFDKNLKGTD